jgi:threonine/homoserine/homoserine lactone efflux protein
LFAEIGPNGSSPAITLGPFVLEVDMLGSFAGIADFGAFVLTTVVFLAIPGPGNLALVTSTAKGRIPGGLAATLGVIAGDQVLLWAAVAGLSAVLTASPTGFGLIQWAGAAYLAWLGFRMITAKPGDAPVLEIRPGQYFRQALFITLLNPKAIVFYMAFFPLFVDPAQHRGLLTFAVMAVTIAGLTFLYGLGATLLTFHLSERFRASPWMKSALEKLAGVLLIGFGFKLVLSR